jgi:hypothetical protein
MQDERPATDDDSRAAETDTEAADPALEADAADADEGTGADPQQPAEPMRSTSKEASPSGAPGIPPPAGDDRVSPEGLAQTTTTGDPEKDFRGPSVTEVARDEMEDDPAMDEPGYADLGHAEDLRILRED